MKIILSSLFFTFCLSAWAGPMDGAPLASPLPRNLWVEMSKRIQPGVVGIYVELDKKQRERFRDPFFDFIEEFLGPGVEFETPEGDQQESPIGTGFVIGSDGFIVTNYHVVKPADSRRFKASLKVKVQGQEKLIPAELIGKDPRGDLAVLKIKSKAKLKALEFGDSDKLQVGEYVAAFGNPYGHSNSMTVGIVSAKGRAIKELNRFPFLQTDASINPGNSGGPLVNTEGYVIGVNTAIDARAQGVGFTIPSNYVKKIVSIIQKGETIKRGYLGIGLATLTNRAARNFGIKQGGVVVTQVQKSSPAQKAGFKTYDIITEFNKKRISNSEELATHVQDTEIGSQAQVKVLRSVNEGPYKEKILKVTIGTFPEKNVKPPTKFKNNYQGQKAPYNLGFTLIDSSSGARLSFDIPVNSPFGPIVNDIDYNGPAAQGDLQLGDIILEVNRKSVNDAQSAIQHMKNGANTLLVHRGGQTKMIFIENE